VLGVGRKPPKKVYAQNMFCCIAIDGVIDIEF